MNQKYLLTLAVALLIVLGGAYVFFQRTSPSPTTSTTATTTATTTMASPTSSGSSANAVTGVTGTGNFTVSTTPNAPQAPSYPSEFTCASSIPASQCSSMQTRYGTLVAQLRTNVANATVWNAIGTLRSVNGDYAGAKAAWEYVTKLLPGNSVGFANLGNLYMSTLRDYPKAEANYLAAIKNRPNIADFYRQLFTLYTTMSYTPSAGAAEDVLKKGIAANPGAVDLQVLLARYYRSLGRTTDASAEYDAAILNARSQGQASLATELEAEKAQ